MKLKILLICLLFPIYALGEEDVLPIAPEAMGEFEGKEIKVFAPNPRLVVSTQTQSKKALSKSPLIKRRVGKQSQLKKNSKRKLVKQSNSRNIKGKVIRRRQPSSTGARNLQRADRKRKVKGKVSKSRKRPSGRVPASVAEKRVLRSKNRM